MALGWGATRPEVVAAVALGVVERAAAWVVEVPAVLAVAGLGLVADRRPVSVVTPLSRQQVAVVVEPRAPGVLRVWVEWAVWVQAGVRVARTKNTSVRRTSLSLTPTACSEPTK